MKAWLEWGSWKMEYIYAWLFFWNFLCWCKILKDLGHAGFWLVKRYNAFTSLLFPLWILTSWIYFVILFGVLIPNPNHVISKPDRFCSWWSWKEEIYKWHGKSLQSFTSERDTPMLKWYVSLGLRVFLWKRGLELLYWFLLQNCFS